MERNGLVDVTLRRDAGKNSEMRAPGAQGQPGDMTEVDQIIVEVRGWGGRLGLLPLLSSVD